jgi:hypothetical protein
MAKLAQFERGAVKTARQLGVRALPADALFECELYEVLRWNNATSEMQRDAETVWKSRDIIDAKVTCCPLDFSKACMSKCNHSGPRQLRLVSRMRRGLVGALCR